MKARLLLGLVLVASNLPVLARFVCPWSNAELMKASELVVIARPIRTEVLEQTNSLGYPAAWALDCIRQDNEASVAALIVAANEEDVQTASMALQALALGKFKSQERAIIPAVIQKLSDSDAAVRVQTAQTLGALSPYGNTDQTKAVVSALIKMLSDTNDQVPIGAAWALGANGSAAEAAFPALLKLTNSDDADLRNPARAALMHIDFDKAKMSGLVN